MRRTRDARFHISLGSAQILYLYACLFYIGIPRTNLIFRLLHIALPKKQLKLFHSPQDSPFKQCTPFYMYDSRIATYLVLVFVIAHYVASRNTAAAFFH